MKKQTWLIQRLRQPHDRTRVMNSLSFGGGLVDGGLSDNIMSQLSEFMGFDYMGSAEFEWGALPNAFSNMALLAMEGRLVRLPEVEMNTKRLASSAFGAFRHKEELDKIADDHTTLVYVVGDKKSEDEILTTVRKAMQDEIRLKERTRAGQAVLECVVAVEHPRKIVGWLELDNGFFFSIDEEMTDNFCHFFGVKE